MEGDPKYPQQLLSPSGSGGMPPKDDEADGSTYLELTGSRLPSMEDSALKFSNASSPPSPKVFHF
jgi:hypothetical protein